MAVSVAQKPVCVPAPLNPLQAGKRQDITDKLSQSARLSSEHCHSLRMKVTYDMYNYQSALLMPPDR